MAIEYQVTKMNALQDYFNRFSEYSGYKVNPSNSTMRGVMKIHLEAGKKIKIADSLKTVFFSNYNPDERTLNEFGYDFYTQTIQVMP